MTNDLGTAAEPPNGVTRTRARRETMHEPTLVPANGDDTTTFDTPPDPSKTTRACPAPFGPLIWLQDASDTPLTAAIALV